MTKQDDTVLKQCPSLLCDCVLEYKHEADGVRVMCICCGVSGPWRDDMDEAAEDWNELVGALLRIGKMNDTIADLKAKLSAPKAEGDERG